jgi:hypothetical protein
MSEAIRLFVQISLLRRGPQDLPASTLLLTLTVIGYVCVNAVVSAALPPIAGWPAQLAVDVLFMLGWYFVVLSLLGRRERFLQTATAVFGFQAVLSPPLIAAEWLVGRSAHDSTWQLLIGAGGLALIVWLIAANSHVVKAALEWSSIASVALVILQVVLGQALLYLLFPAAGS